MPTIVTHAFVATLLGKGIAVGRMPARFWILSALFSVLPDIDVLGFPLGIRYEDMMGHCGLSHSLFFAFVFSWIVAFLTFPRLPERWTRFLLFSYFFAVTASHGALVHRFQSSNHIRRLDRVCKTRCGRPGPD
jgi:inner membrane protein